MMWKTIARTLVLITIFVLIYYYPLYIFSDDERFFAFDTYNNMPSHLYDYYDMKFLEEIADALHSFQEENSRYPTNDEGLEAIAKRMSRPLIDREYYYYRQFASFPILYENRRGMDERLFLDSPVEQGLGYYSLKVDEGIYIYSVSALNFRMQYLDDYSRSKSIVVTNTFFFVLILFVLGIVYIILRPRNSHLTPIQLFLHIIIAIFFLSSDFESGRQYTSCYATAGYVPEENPYKDTAVTRNLLEKYYSRNVIKKETYDKLMKSISIEERK
jgi:hypothetical protein